ncbi:MAG: YkuS family protein [Hyphomonadaceae bacterium]|nr:YkuS family protein [Clostridia bacterium]
MIVAVQKGMEHLKENLRLLGYEVVTYGEYHYPIDALVYMGSISSLSMHVNSSTDTEQAGKGVFLVNGTQKSVSDIDQMLKHRSYSPIF